MEENQLPEKFRPLSMWAYVGYQLLFTVPLVGFICLLVFAFGASSNKNLQNFARGVLALRVIAVVIAILITVLFMVLGFAAFGSASNSINNSFRYYNY